MRDWLMELCPEMVEWQADLIVDHVERLVRHEREECAKVCETHIEEATPDYAQAAWNCARQIRARGEKQ